MILELTLLSTLAFFLYVSTAHRSIPPRQKKNDGRKKEIQYQGRLYDVTDWVKRHPGGKLIEYYVNNDEDASIPIQQFHNRSAKKVWAILKSFKNRPLPENISGEKDQKLEELTQDFYQLFQELQDEGLFKPSLIYTLLRLCEVTLLGTLGIILIVRSESIAVTALGVICLHFFQFRSGFLMHEGGHHSLTGRPAVDRMIESLVMGLSYGHSGAWWSSAHNRHHAMPQRLDHDVDLNTLPLFVFHPSVIENQLEKYNKFISHQFSLGIITSTIGRLSWNLHVSPRYAWKNKKYHELLIFAVHYFGAYQIGLYPYIFMAMMNSPFMFFTFSMSHSHTPVTEVPRHWMEYSTVHTINVEPSWWCDYVMGYLNYQIEHHLFPTMPQFKLGRISGRVRALVQKHGLPYTCVSYGEAIQKVLTNMSQTSRELDEQSKLKGQKPGWFSNSFRAQ